MAKKQITSSYFFAEQLKLPAAPASESGVVKAWSEPITIRSYMPERPDRNPMFLERRVYQGSSGRVYPLPFTDRIATEATLHEWRAIHIENEFVRLMILPEIGGRIHTGYDKMTGYDFFYRQNVIKPALVGLAGPWISGGVEFNWPQHHRPATFMPVETEIERHADGSVTIWCSDHDPMLRMKGMHGVCLHPGRALLELRARLYNRTPFMQTFLWWANVATRVHERYQSFFPTDVRFVADHAKRAVTSFPRSNGSYYGVDYAERARTGVPAEEQPRMFRPDGSYPATDLSWYANIPVPTSYMITGTEEDFFGGYDHAADAGVVHVANHHIAPGKKQWTWGNHEFGYAWDRNLTDADKPYIELMAGAYTDNQPDFSYLAPWETKTFTQSWFPIHKIGVPQAANLDAALRLSVEHDQVRVAVQATRGISGVEIVLRSGDKNLASFNKDLKAAYPVVLTRPLGPDAERESVAVFVCAGGREIISYDPAAVVPAKAPKVAEEPAAPEQIATVEELYLTGVHLDQYRHATRSPELYWREALCRDPQESRCHNALGLWHLRRGEFGTAVAHFNSAIARLTQLNSNPYDGEAFYNLGLALRFQGQDKEAYDAFYKATWNAGWRGPAYFALAELDARGGRWEIVLDHAERSMKAETDSLNARNLRVIALRSLGRIAEAETLLQETSCLDRLDVGSRWLRGISPANNQQRLDLAFDLMRSGQDKEAVRVLITANFSALDGSVPIVRLVLAHLYARAGEREKSETEYRKLVSTPLDYCFPNRLDELILLPNATTTHPQLAAPHYLLGNLLYDRRRYEEAIAAWEIAAALESSFATVRRNLGIAYFNVRHLPERAMAAFDRAMERAPSDGRLLYERDQLAKRVGIAPQTRLDELLRHPLLIEQRDDLSVEVITLYSQTGRPEKALPILQSRHFQPWEGGEGLVLGQWVRAHLLIGQRALQAAHPEEAIEHFEAALTPPLNLSEATHLLANQSDIYYWTGVAYDTLGEVSQAKAWWEKATRQRGDFQQMSVRAISEMTYWSAMAYLRLRAEQEARRIFQQIESYSYELEREQPKIDYFATSLPAMLLFEEDLKLRNEIAAKFLRAQAWSGLQHSREAEQMLKEVLALDTNHMAAADLLRQIASTHVVSDAG